MVMHIRVSSASDANTYYSQKLVIDGLTYRAGTYYHLKLTNTQTNQTYDARVNGGGTSGAYYTPAFTFTGLSPGVRYEYKAEARYLSSSGLTTEYNYLTTPSLPNPPSTPSAPTLNGSANVNTGTQSFNIYYPSNTTRIYISRSWSTLIDSGVSSSSSGSFVTTQSNIPVGTHYIQTMAENANGTSNWSTPLYFVMGEKPKPPVPSISVSSSSENGRTFLISYGAGTDIVYIDRSWSSEISSYTNNTSSGSFNSGQTSIPVGTHYVRVRAYNSSGFSNYSAELSFTIVDTVKPTLTVSLNGYNAITATMTSSDNSNQFRYERYSIYIDGTYLGRTDSNTYTIDRDKDGGILQTGTTYSVRVDLYDASGNYDTITNSVKLIRTRPTEMAWDTAKVAGNTFNLTAVEWNRLTERINEFRQYRGYVTMSYTRAVKGEDFTAVMFNQAVNTMASLTTPVSPPSTKVAGDTIFASDIDRLRTSLNSVV